MSFLVDDQLRSMDHLDLAGFIAVPSSNWQIPAFEPSPFEQQDALYLASSRQMLEPIMEETSEDEESNHNSWTQYENHSVWSSESETGSVIRIEVSRDPDSISERDFACPAKRARRDEFIIGGLLTCQPLLDESNPLRKYQRHDLLSTAIDQLNLNETNSLTNTLSTGSTGQRKRFDEFYCDMDSVSCNSLSRSSSLIQFESLERQLLNEQGLCSSLGNSSPSLLSFEGGCIDGGTGSGSNSNRGSTGSLKRYESSSGRLHQTYFDLDKIDFAENLHFTSTAASKSDSESSSDNSVASHKIVSKNGVTHARNVLRAGKNSAENLSEDSGYCEYIHSVLRAKSKSIPSFEKFCEEDEFYDHSLPVAMANSGELRKSHSKIQTTTSIDEAPKIDGALTSPGVEAKQPTESAVTEEDDADDDNEEVEEEEDEEEVDGDCWYTGDKNSRRSPSSSSPISSDDSSATSTHTAATSSSCASASSFTWRPAAIATCTSAPAAKIEISIAKAPLQRSPNRSSSLPDILAEEASFALTPTVVRPSPERHDYQRPNHYYQHTQQSDAFAFQSDNTERVTSVPSDLDRIDNHHQSTNYPTYQEGCSTHPQRHRRSSAHRRLPLLRRTLSASSSSDLEDEDQSEQSTVVVRSNSWKRTRSSASAERLESSSQSARSLHSIGSGSGIGYINASYNDLTLLDYSGRPRSNRNSLSEENRTNSKQNSYEMCDILDEIESSLSDSKTEEERDDTEEDIQHVQLTIRKPPPRRNVSTSNPISKTFDQDPTCLKTSYAQSLEKCNFDPKELSNLDLTRIPPKRRFHSTSAAKKRAGMVSSTPNLNTFNHEEGEEDMFVSSAHTSMNQLPTNEKRLGILLPAGSRSSFGKGVSFCPVVSKYMWQEQSSEECADISTANEPQDGATVVGIEETTSKENDTKETPTKSDSEESDIEKTSPTEENAVKEKITITISSVIATAATNSLPSSTPNSTKAPVVERGSDCYQIKPEPTQSPVTINNNVSVKPPLVPVIDHSPRSIRRVSNRHLDNPRPATPVPQILVYSPSGSSVNSVKMSNYAVKCSAASGDTLPLNNNNELVKSKFKADEKHPQHKGFLSRFGFRFSLRRNKKKKQKEIQEAQEKGGQLPPIPPPSRKQPAQNSPDFIYIPLKGSNNKSSKSSSSTFYCSTGNGSTPCNNGKSSPSPSTGSNHVLNAKQQQGGISPVQKPPRVVGVCEKRAQSAGQHAPQYSAAPQSIDAKFLDNERSYYDFKNQLNGVTNGNGCNTEHNITGPVMNNSNSSTTMYHYHHQTQMPQPVASQHQQQQQLNHCKIGLIETNLDTHETKISGKTRSLMELGPQLKYNFTLKRNTSGYEVDGGGGSGGVGYDDEDGIDDDDDVDGSGCDGEDSGVVGVKKSGGVGGSAAVAVRRPHKSMEFLLDKENQKNVLVRIHIIIYL